MRKPNVKLADNWFGELLINHTWHCLDGGTVVTVNLINSNTGEIRQKQLTFDALIRKAFDSEIKTWNKKYDSSMTKQVRK